MKRMILVTLVLLLGLFIDILQSDPMPTSFSTTEFAEQQYRDFLNREADAGGLAYWVNQIDTGAMTRAQVIESFFWSEEFGVRIAPIVRLYFAYFLRIPDYEGLMYWVDAYNSDTSLGAISDSFAGSEEFRQRYGSLSNDGFVELIYQNILGRSPDSGGYAFWVGELNSGLQTRGQVMLGFSESDEYKSASSHEVFVTMMYVGMLRRSPEQDGFDFWVNHFDSGGSGLALIDGFLNSQEYANRFYGTPEASATIGPVGGTVEVTNPSSPLYGVKIEIPPDALSAETIITISKVENGSQGTAVNIGPSGTIFRVPATVTIPYKDEINEEFFTIVTAEVGETIWTHYSNYIVDTVLNKVSCEVSHLSVYQIALFTPPGEIKIFFKGISETAQATIREAIFNGPWKEFYDCIGVPITEASNENEATIIIRWGDLPSYANAGTLSSPIPSHCYELVCWYMPKEIVLNENKASEFHITLDENIGQSIDLYSVIAHEFGHVLGLPEYTNPDYPENAVSDDLIKLGEVARVLQTIDKTKIRGRHPECCPTPGTPSSPSPSNGGTGVSTSPTLSWAGTSDTDSYDVYFGTSSNPPLVTNVTSPSYPLSALSPNSTYYWKVDAKNSCGHLTNGPLWTFTTTPCQRPSALTLSCGPPCPGFENWPSIAATVDQPCPREGLSLILSLTAQSGGSDWRSQPDTFVLFTLYEGDTTQSNAFAGPSSCPFDRCYPCPVPGTCTATYTVTHSTIANGNMGDLYPCNAWPTRFLNQSVTCPY